MHQSVVVVFHSATATLDGRFIHPCVWFESRCTTQCCLSSSSEFSKFCKQHHQSPGNTNIRGRFLSQLRVSAKCSVGTKGFSLLSCLNEFSTVNKNINHQATWTSVKRLKHFLQKSTPESLYRITMMRWSNPISFQEKFLLYTRVFSAPASHSHYSSALAVIYSYGSSH